MAGLADSRPVPAGWQRALTRAPDNKAEGAAPHKVGHAAIAYGQTRDILTRTSGYLKAYDYSLNPYAGCSFGCTYCYAAFFSRSRAARDSWGYWVTVKRNAVDTLAKRCDGTLDGKRIYMSSVTDPYQPVERTVQLTRSLLAVLCKRHAPVLVIQTRSPNIVRDLDLLGALQDSGGTVQVNMTITTDDEDIRRTFEPFCPSNRRRLTAIAQVRAAGIDACITLTPLLLIRDARRFADQLLETNVRRFVCQDFQFGGGHFVASTRAEAQRLIASRLGCSIGAFRKQYRAHYEKVRAALRSRLCPPAIFTEGKDGFAPPA